MNSLGNCRAEFSGWRFTQLHSVPIEVMDMEKNPQSSHFRPRALLIISMQPAVHGLVENCSCKPHIFLSVKERRLSLSFWFLFLQLRVRAPQSPGSPPVYVGKGRSLRERVWILKDNEMGAFCILEDPLGPMGLEEMRKTYLYRKQAEIDPRMHD